MSVRIAARLCAAFLLLSTAVAGPLDKPMHEVEQVRGLKFLHEVKTASIDRNQVPERLRQEMLKSLPYSLDEYMLVLKTLRFVDPASKDLVSKLLSLFESQVLAFYDPQTHVYYSIRQASPAAKEIDSATMEEIVAVHELTHALQDQRFDIGKYDETIKTDWDASLAYHSVIEGEASLVMMASIIAKTGQKFDDIINNEMMLNALSEAAAKPPAIDTTMPPYFVKSLVFPYFDGLKFVVAAYRRGGWAAVDRLYKYPPRSTREILHPDDYFDRVADAKAQPEPPIARVVAPHVLTSEHLGEWHWGFLVGAGNARGWINDRVTVVENDAKEPTVLAESLWDDAAHAKAFADAYAKFLSGQGIDPVVVLTGPDVKVGYGADRALLAHWSGKGGERPAE
jgi:hypothetical protein